MTDYTSIYEEGGAAALPDSFWSELKQAVNDPAVPAYSSTGVPLNQSAKDTVSNFQSAGLINVNPVTGAPTSVNQPSATQQYTHTNIVVPLQNTGYVPQAIITPTPEATQTLDISPITEDDPDDPDEDLLPDLGTGLNINITVPGQSSGGSLLDLFNFDLSELFAGFSLDFGNFNFDNLFKDFNFDFDFKFEGLFAGLTGGIGTLLFGEDLGGVLGETGRSILGMNLDLLAPWTEAGSQPWKDLYSAITPWHDD